MSIVTLRSAETFWEREFRESLFWLVDGLVLGGWVRGEEDGAGGPFAFVGFGHGGWWGKVRVEEELRLRRDGIDVDVVVVVVVVVSHSQAKWMDV